MLCLLWQNMYVMNWDTPLGPLGFSLAGHDSVLWADGQQTDEKMYETAMDL